MLSTIIGFLGAWFVAGSVCKYWEKQYDAGVCKGRAAKRFILEKEGTEKEESQEEEG